MPKIAPEHPAENTNPITDAFLNGLDPAERADAEQLAEARQQLAAVASYNELPRWEGMTGAERVTATIEALYYLRAARGLDLAR